jgi:hypothetical protein
VNSLRKSLDNSALPPFAASRLLGALNLSEAANLEPETGCVHVNHVVDSNAHIEIMSDSVKNLAKSKAIITSACSMLHQARKFTPTFGRELYASSADSYILLHDATKLFCQYVGENYGETDAKRWSPALPELLLSHPEKCAETLALIERKDFKELSYFQFVAA